VTPIYDALYAEMFGDDSPIYDELTADTASHISEAEALESFDIVYGGSLDVAWLIQVSRMRAKASPARRWDSCDCDWCLYPNGKPVECEWCGEWHLPDDEHEGVHA